METASQQLKLPIVKHYESFLEEDRVRIVMYRKGRRYGVVMFRGDAASTINSSGEVNTLTTFAENKHSIIEWMPVERANELYSQMLQPLLMHASPAKRAGHPPELTLVSAQ